MGQRARDRGGAWWQWRWAATDRATFAAPLLRPTRCRPSRLGPRCPCAPRWRPSNPPNDCS